MKFSNRFGYSLSREALFDDCKRRYYFHYYFSWGGWNASAPALVREAFKLKRLVSVPLWRGQLIHYVASKVLQSMKAKGRIPDCKRVIAYMLERFDRQLEFSRRRRYLTEPKKSGNRLNIDWLALFDHEYRAKIDPDRLERSKRECIEAVENLIGGRVLQAVARTDPSSWTIEDLDHAEFSQQFQFEGTTVYAKTDFTFRDTDGTFNIIDWKTHRKSGRQSEPYDSSRDIEIQLGVYGYHAAAEGVPLDSIRLRAVNLLDKNETFEYGLDESGLERIRTHLKTGIARLVSVLQDEDPGKNEPLASRFFPKIENGRCRFCNFYRICKDETYPHGFAD